jgi:hypothetical protein
MIQLWTFLTGHQICGPVITFIRSKGVHCTQSFVTFLSEQAMFGSTANFTSSTISSLGLEDCRLALFGDAMIRHDSINPGAMAECLWLTQLALKVTEVSNLPLSSLFFGRCVSRQ